MIRRAVVFALALSLIGSAASAAPAPNERDSYIVVLKPSAGNPRSVAAEHSRAHGAQVRHVYRHALRGYSARMSATAAARLSSDGRVSYVEPDGEAHTVDHASTHQSPATWGLDRIDQRLRPLDGIYGYNAGGSGVRAYIIDTGIRAGHQEFGGRVDASLGYTAINDGNGTNDCNGHGTHVAGTVGGSTYGVAKSVTLVPVRVLGCSGSGTWSGVIAGVDWVTAHKNANKGVPMVANMSLGGGGSTSVDNAVTNSINAGVSYSVAAGNSGADACNYSPARTPAALTVGATGSTDQAASWSNRGPCLDLFAPGVGITAAWHTSNSATNTISGTSMASPHVAGAAALYLEKDPGATAGQVADAITDTATKDVLGSVDGTTGNGRWKTALESPNLLLYSLFGVGSAPPGNVAPVASFDVDCTGLTCDFTDTSSDTDGTVVGWSWNFGDGTTSSVQNPSHSYSVGDTYTVSLTVTDNGGKTGSTSSPVTVKAGTGGDPDPPSGLTVDRGPSKGVNNVFNLAWTATTSVDVYRDGHRITTSSGNTYEDKVKGSGPWVYKVCNAGTAACSDEVQGT